MAKKKKQSTFKDPGQPYKDVDMGDDAASMLTVLATFDSIEATAMSVTDHSQGRVPQWCEVTLDLKRHASMDIGGDDPVDQRLHLRRHDGELIIEVLHNVLHDWTGTNSDQIWDMVDGVVDRVQRRVEKGKKPDPVDVGKIQGLLMALAIAANPYDPDLDGFREVALTRYELRR